MNDPKHRALVAHYEACLVKFGDSHRGVDWPNERDAHRRYLVMLDLVRECEPGMTLLDFGCGASHLYPYLQGSPYSSLTYHGLDASPAFCELSRKKYPGNPYYCLDILSAPGLLAEFDYVVMNGVFTEKRELGFEEMLEYFKQMLRVVFPKVRLGLAFNVMSSIVDWQRDDLFHLPTDMLSEFLCNELSRNFVIRNDYGLYEYTTYVYRNASYG